MPARPSIASRALPALLSAATLSACAVNPVSGRPETVLMSEKKEIEIGKQMHVQVTQQMGVYPDLELADYLQKLGTKIAKTSERPELDWKFTIVDTDDLNAFATPGGYVYLSRGILPYLQSEAELAAVIGHEIGHITARHAVRQQTQGALAGVASTAAAIFTGQPALADLTNLAGAAVVRGYGREMELEADRLGAQYLVKNSYAPENIIKVVGTLKDHELFDKERARSEGRQPNNYHGLFSTHPDNDLRLREAIDAARKVGAGTKEFGDDKVEDYLRLIDGLAFGSSRSKGIVRGTRVYHADMQFTVAFPQGWRINNEDAQILATSPDRHNVIQMKATAIPPNVKSVREYATRLLGNLPLAEGRELEINGLPAYTVIARGMQSPFGQRPVRVTVIEFGNLYWMFMGASRGGEMAPDADRVIQSATATFRRLRSNEFRLAEPYRIRVVKVRDGETIETFAKESPLGEYAAQQLRLLNDLYPSGQPKAGQWFKIVQ